MYNSNKIIVVEDEFAIALDIQTSLIKKGFDVPAIADTFDKVIDLISDHNPDLILMDIHINGDKNGIEIAEYVYENFNIPTVFLTASSDLLTFKEALKAKPFGFVLKPFNIENLLRVILVALEKHIETDQTKNEINQIKRIVSGNSFSENTDVSGYYNSSSDKAIVKDHLFIKNKSKFIRIKVSEILWIIAMDNYSVIVTDDKRTVANLFLKELEGKLPKDKFIRVHRSYIVAISKIDKIEANTLYINNNNIPVSKSYKARLLARLNAF
ncbi:LytR/AlgR family response regulator transcription factor [Aquimarina sp. LLG6339-5]|uniref:LytR/AlgR family response regulator transcription factor n=1 Tax=Aquimarina sp. LLG6339-5 TaxID=3160830 RepID=UPI003863976F